MRKILFVFILIIMGLPTVFADTKCTYTYVYSEYILGKEESNANAEGATIELQMPSKKAKVTKTAENSFLFFDFSFDFGNSDTIDWSKENCPLYIVAYADKADWYGFDEKPNLSQFVENKDTKALYSQGMHIFMNDNPSENIYTCNYEGFSIIFDSEGKAISTNSKLTTSTMIFSYTLDSSLKDFPAEVPGKCENVYTCLTSTTVSQNLMTRYYNVYSGSMDLAAKQKEECYNGVMTLFEVQTNEEISKEEGDNSACRTYKFRWDLLQEMYNDCIVNISTCTIYKNYKKNLKEWCNNVTNFVNYGDKCLEYCLGLGKEINNLEKTTLTSSQCGFSERLIIWIANIVKWVKYIIPIIVIMLGILDFIKAIASDKEDEMKKAQGHFTKRLIAAALIFIIPFILEFILNKMGFAANGCGIIDL